MIFPIVLIVYVVAILVMLFIVGSSIVQLWSYRIPGDRHILGIASLLTAFVILLIFSIGAFISVPWETITDLIFNDTLNL